MTELPKSAPIFVAGHRGLVGSAILRALRKEGYTNLLTATREQLDLRDQAAVNYWFKANRPEYVFLVAGTVGGILANSSRPAEFIYDNMMIHATVVHSAYLYGIKKLLYLGSSCIYPRECPQPMKEEYLLSGWLEPTNEPYAVAKIAGIKLCQAYRKQYGCNFISAMPTNLYGPGDNFDLLSSHVLPALIRKFHLAKLSCQGDREGIERDEALFGPIPNDLRQSLGLLHAAQDKNPLPQAEPVFNAVPLNRNEKISSSLRSLRAQATEGSGREMVLILNYRCNPITEKKWSKQLESGLLSAEAPKRIILRNPVREFCSPRRRLYPPAWRPYGLEAEPEARRGL